MPVLPSQELLSKYLFIRHSPRADRQFEGIFTTDHQKWHESRQLIRPQFIKDRLSDLNTFERHIQLLLPRLRGNGETIDIADLFFRSVFEVKCEGVPFGVKILIFVKVYSGCGDRLSTWEERR